jgi:hypothetical protein
MQLYFLYTLLLEPVVAEEPGLRAKVTEEKHVLSAAFQRNSSPSSKQAFPMGTKISVIAKQQ